MPVQHARKGVPDHWQLYRVCSAGTSAPRGEELEALPEAVPRRADGEVTVSPHAADLSVDQVAFSFAFTASAIAVPLDVAVTFAFWIAPSFAVDLTAITTFSVLAAPAARFLIS